MERSWNSRCKKYLMIQKKSPQNHPKLLPVPLSQYYSDPSLSTRLGEKNGDSKKFNEITSNTPEPKDIWLARRALTYRSNSFSSAFEIWDVDMRSSRSILAAAAAARKKDGAVFLRFCGSIMYSVSGMFCVTRDVRCL